MCMCGDSGFVGNKVLHQTTLVLNDVLCILGLAKDH